MAANNSKTSYEDLSLKLDNILGKLENFDTDVDEASKLYEEGMKIVEQLDKHLGQAKNRVSEIAAKFNPDTVKPLSIELSS
jgi:exodeoxyribonuclease VII small subunit